MAYAIVLSFPGGTKEQYEALLAACDLGPGQLPEGQIFHCAGQSAGGWKIIAVHDSKASWERFQNGVLKPAFERGVKGGFAMSPQETYFEVHTLLPKRHTEQS